MLDVSDLEDESPTQCKAYTYVSGRGQAEAVWMTSYMGRLGSEA